MNDPTLCPSAPLNPCDEYRRLKKALEEVALGETVRSTRYRNGEEERQTDFHPGNINLLKSIVAEARADCEASMGMHRRRSAISFSGFRRPPYGGM